MNDYFYSLTYLLYQGTDVFAYVLALDIENENNQ